MCHFAVVLHFQTGFDQIAKFVCHFAVVLQFQTTFVFSYISIINLGFVTEGIANCSCYDKYLTRTYAVV